MYRRIKLMLDLVKNDLKSRYSGAALGLIWAYVQPLMTILVFWYVFQIGFRNPPVNDVEFILWFIAGYIPWTFYNDGVLSSTNVLYEYSFLVKKMKFNVWKLPLIKVMSAFCVHSAFIIFITGMYFLYGYSFHFSWLSMIYYSFATSVLLVGVSYFVSAVAVFFKDFSQVISVVMQIAFWLTPVFWSETSINEKVLKVFKLNPLYYILTGYRDALINNKSFWQQSVSSTLYFWGVCFLGLVIGILVFKALKKHFSDLL